MRSCILLLLNAFTFVLFYLAPCKNEKITNKIISEIQPWQNVRYIR